MKPKLSIIVKWPDTDGWQDVIPIEALRKSSGPEGIRHKVRHTNKSKPESEAKCRLTVKSPTVVDLDYRPFDSFNKPRDMLSGVATLVFESPDRTKLSAFSWRKGANKSTQKASQGSFSFELPPPGLYKRSDALKAKVQKLVTEREGQAKFRAILQIVYGHACCFTGCPLSRALDGAHIDAYRNAASHHPTNGLLLRRDLHALFDAHLIGVKPDTMKIHVSSQVRAYAEYAALHQKPIRLPKEKSYTPDFAALSRHWKLFLKNA